MSVKTRISWFKWLSVGLMWTLVVAAFVGLVYLSPLLFVMAISWSHVSGNVPPADRFDDFMQRDLDAYFSGRQGARATVRWKLLRQGATQSGTGWPKYYVWVDVTSSEARASVAGAACVAAIDGAHFEVFDFFTDRQFRSDLTQAQQAFPAPVLVKIMKRCGLDTHGAEVEPAMKRG